jgi:hypothetical protein
MKNKSKSKSGAKLELVIERLVNHVGQAHDRTSCTSRIYCFVG